MEQEGAWIFVLYVGNAYLMTVVRTPIGDFLGGPVEAVDLDDLEQALIRRVHAGMPSGEAPRDGYSEVLRATGLRSERALKKAGSEWVLASGKGGVELSRIPRTNREPFECERYSRDITIEQAVSRLVRMARSAG